MNFDEHFSHPLKTWRWAQKQIEQFEVAESAFFNENPGKEFSYFDFVRSQMVHGIEFAVRPTDELEEMALQGDR